MGSTDSFADILARKIEKEVEARLRAELQLDNLDRAMIKNSPPLQKSFPFDTIASLIGKVSPTTVRPSGKAEIYHRHRPKTPPTRRPHKLNATQEAALKFFSSNDQSLPSGFTLNELRRAYRRLALHLHPDRNGGSTGPFIQLKQAFDTLKTLFV